MNNSSKSVLQTITDFLNLQQGSSLSPADLEFGMPRLSDPTIKTLTHPTQRNTTVDVKGIASGAWSDAFTVHYNRLHLEQMFIAFSKNIQIDNEQTIYELLPKINALIKFNLTEEDVFDGPLEGEGPFTLYAQPSSYGVFGSIELTTEADSTPAWFSLLPRQYLTVRSAEKIEDTLTLEQTADEPVYVAAYGDPAQANIFHQFSDLGDLTFEGGFVYAVPPNVREYSRLMESLLDFPEARVYVGSSAFGLKLESAIEEVEGSTARKRNFVAVPYGQADTVTFTPEYRLVWLRFSHEEFDRPINFLFRTDAFPAREPTVDPMQAVTVDGLDYPSYVTTTLVDGLEYPSSGGPL